MKETLVPMAGTRLPLYSLNTLIIGSGAAGLNAAVRLHDLGQTDIAILTDRWGGGTSFNSGSDKQTYYKMSVAGGEPDSPLLMARDLSAGGSMHGDIALAEALGSLESFFHLVRLGVPFPHDRYGAFVGYKTDHDPRQRATSAGPLTSRFMGEALGREVERKGIRVFDGHRAVALFTSPEGRGRRRVIGAAALDLARPRGRGLGFVLFNARNVILATGGPGDMYRYSVYPEGQAGAQGLGLAAGASTVNLTESQFGLASIKFRWNLSGTYQQVVPRYFSTAPDGGDEREFLTEVFPDMGRLATAVFLKGYQWPFDPRKVENYGSSLVDLLAYRETVVRGRRVFLDYGRNPSGGGRLADFNPGLLSAEARAYLKNSGALLPLPIDRLRKMNGPAIELFRSNGIDLAREPLEIAVCAQHNNGGFAGNLWWESDLRHLFPVGEANGSHGVYRPGGSALNAGQVGSLRAARYIARRYADDPPPARRFLAAAGPQIRSVFATAARMIDRAARARGGSDLESPRREIRERMSACAAHIRDPRRVDRERAKAWALLRRLREDLRVSSAAALPDAFRLLDMALTHAVYLEALKEYLARGGRSRGSYLVLDPAGQKPCPEMEDDWRFAAMPEDSIAASNVLEIRLDAAGRPRKTWRPVRPIPAAEAWFETVWNDFLEDRIIREEEPRG